MDETPATPAELAAAMAALGVYGGDNMPAEHAAEGDRLGGPDAYWLALANALLGAVQANGSLPRGPR